MAGVLYKYNNTICKIFLYLTCFKIQIIWLTYVIFLWVKMLLICLPLFRCYHEIKKKFLRIADFSFNWLCKLSFVLWLELLAMMESEMRYQKKPVSVFE